MVKDEKTLETFRVDHLIEDHFNKLLEDPKVEEPKKEIVRE